MGGCHSYPSATKADGTALQPSDINNEKLRCYRNNGVHLSKIAGETWTYVTLGGINNNNLEERPYLQQQYVCQRVTHMDMLALSALPPGVDKAEWLASNTVAFFKHINLFSSALSEFCTPSSCPTACGPGNIVYVWTDDHGRKLKCSAPLYFDYAMSYIHELLTDEDVFPTKAGAVFPTGFVFLVQKVFLLLFRTLAHIYWSHYRETLTLGLHPHLNTLFTHLTFFCRQHALLEPEDTEPLQDLITALGQQGGT